MNRFDDFTEVKRYWLSLFPEIHDMSELNNLIQEVSNQRMDDFEFNAGSKDEQLNLISLILEKLNTEKSKIDMSNIYINKFENLPFYKFYEPIINLYFDTFYEKLSRFNFIEDINDFVTEINVALINIIAKIGVRSLILETNIARMSERLKGKNGDERFSFYNKFLLKNSKYLEELYLTYPTLVELLCLKISHFYNYIIEILTNLENDWDDIISAFPQYEAELILKSINTGMGDEHKNGKSVARLNFTNNLKLMYKPRNLSIEVGFNELIEWIHKENIQNYIELQKLIIIKKNDYGWVEYVEHHSCKNIQEVQGFYKRIGELLFLLYSLDAVDFHHENLIACGTHPVLVDLETLLHPRIKSKKNYLSDSWKQAQKLIDESVLSVGFLPYFQISNDDLQNRLDVSGLGGEAEQISPFKTLKIINEKSDDIKIEWVNDRVQPQKNNPKLNGEIIYSDRFTIEIEDGFKTIYRWAMDNKDKYLIKIQELFSDAECRVILKPTRQYAQLLRVSYHPDFLREYVHRFILLHRIAVNVPEDQKKLIESELSDLKKGEVPYFTCLSDKRHIYNSDGCCFENFLPLKPLDVISTKIQNLGMDDIKFQTKLIDMSYQIKTCSYEKDATRILFNRIDNDDLQYNKKQWLNTAVEIGEYLLNISIIGYDKAKNRTWVSSSLDTVNESSVTITPVGDDLYNGNSGIALFLTYLGYITKDSRFELAAKEAMQSSIRFIENIQNDQKTPIGAFNGICGSLYTIFKMYHLLKDDSCAKYCIRYLEIIKSQIEKDMIFDLIGGSTGCLAVMLSIYENSDNEVIRNLAIDNANLCYLHLHNNKKLTTLGGISWGDDKLFLSSSGFAHGVSGTIAFLSKLMAITKDNNIKKTIDEALYFEQHLFSERHGNWYMNSKKEKVCYGWCHGAPGILASKVMIKKYHTETNILNVDLEMKLAFQTTISKCFGLNPSLCHGDLGQLDILLGASHMFKEFKLINGCNNTFNDFFDHVILKRWRQGVLRGTESVGLMNGLSGFGYALLRFYAPQSIPSVLMLE